MNGTVKQISNREANIRDSICYVDVDVKSKLDDEDLTMRWTGNQALYKVHEYCAPKNRKAYFSAQISMVQSNH
jgi:hypothetical protein